MIGFPQRTPFGQTSCEQELTALGRESYPDYFFDHAPFNERAIDASTYLIIGRRGSGKTSLANYLGFQQKRPGRAIDVDEPQVYERILSRVAAADSSQKDRAVSQTALIWECVIWHLVFNELGVKEGTMPFREQGSGWSTFVRSLLNAFLGKLLGTDGKALMGQLDQILESSEFAKAKEKSVQLMKSDPVYVAIDTLERYDVSDNDLMNATAALIEAASAINRGAGSTNLHVKVMMSAEIFPHLRDQFVRNTLKHIQDPLFLHWKPKDLLRLASWRLYRFLSGHGEDVQSDVDWNNFDSVMTSVWRPHFGEQVINGSGLPERSFPYVLRHTQMRPRQMIFLCNAIAQAALEKGTFPKFYAEKCVVAAVKEAEIELASEVLNSYATIYPNVDKVVTALHGLPMIFKGNELDRVSYRSKKDWDGNGYDRSQFKQILSELGIVGIVRKRQEGGPVVTADFEYFLRDRLVISERDECVIHPMFYGKLRTKTEKGVIVYPFPDHPEYRMMHD